MCVISWLIVSTVSVAAHDLERTQVSIAFARDGAFVLDVSNDPNWLLQRLEPFEKGDGSLSSPSANDGLGSKTPPEFAVVRLEKGDGSHFRDIRLRELAGVSSYGFSLALGRPKGLTTHVKARALCIHCEVAADGANFWIRCP